ncbi:MAG TPA: hypothetical protein PLD47_04925 [Aggregatilineales bacterium]|nr:PD40 domain-containing protein [Anaerolineales bacterium]HRE47048.1 hypothetical protein [Aggregatilineales bacterium]
MRRVGLFFMVIALALSFIVPSFSPTAQPDDPALVLNVRPANGGYYESGDHYEWRASDPATLRQRSTWGYNRNPILSPDGQWVTYLSVAALGVSAIREGRFPRGMGEVDPVNIWVISNTSPDEVRTATQPADGVLADPNGLSDNIITRSAPAWSPDASQLAWVEWGFGSNDPSNQVKLVVYDMTKREGTPVTVLVDTPIGYEGYILPQVRWGETGIAVLVTQIEYNQAAQNFTDRRIITVYSPEGSVISSSTVLNTAQLPFDYDFIWVDGVEHLFTIGTEVLIDPRTGVQSELVGDPYYVSAVSADTQLGAYIAGDDARTFGVNTQKGYIPLAATGVGAVYSVYSRISERVAIAPDGKHLVYVTDQGEAWISGMALNQKIPTTGMVTGVVWGPMRWVLMK